MSEATARQAAHEIALLEDHAATINRALEILQYGLANARAARDAALAQRIDAEIAYMISRLAEVHARRDALHRALQRGGDAERE